MPTTKPPIRTPSTRPNRAQTPTVASRRPFSSCARYGHEIPATRDNATYVIPRCFRQNANGVGAARYASASATVGMVPAAISRIAIAACVRRADPGMPLPSWPSGAPGWRSPPQGRAVEPKGRITTQPHRRDRPNNSPTKQE